MIIEISPVFEMITRKGLNVSHSFYQMVYSHTMYYNPLDLNELLTFVEISHRIILTVQKISLPTPQFLLSSHCSIRNLLQYIGGSNRTRLGGPSVSDFSFFPVQYTRLHFSIFFFLYFLILFTAA